MSLPDLTDQVQRAIIAICMREAPQEAVGILLRGDQVVTLPNHAPEPQRGFFIRQADVIEALAEVDIDAKNLRSDEVTIWHSHPNGGVGPSRTDMRNKVSGAYHLVVSLTPDPVFTWY